MDGEVVLSTGANSGVGFVTARGVAELGAAVVMVGRNPGAQRRTPRVALESR